MSLDDPRAMAESLGLSAEMIRERLEAIRLTAHERQMLHEAKPSIRPSWPAFIQRLHRRYRSTPPLANFVQQESRLRRLEEFHETYLEELYGAPIDQAYVLRRLSIGLVHHQLRITPQWYLATAAHFLCEQIDALLSQTADPSMAMALIDSLHKTILFDASLALDAYGRREETTLLQRSRVYADPPESPSRWSMPIQDRVDQKEWPRADTGITRIRLDDAEAGLRAAYLGLNRGDQKRLRALRDLFERTIPSLLDDFYAFIAGVPFLTRLVPPSQIGTLKQQLMSYWSELVGGQYDRLHAASRMRIGVIHESIGLEPQWYLLGLGRQISGILRAIPVQHPDLARTLKAFFRAVFFDITFVIDAYMEARAHSLLHVKGYANQLMAGLSSAVVIVDHRLRVQFANESFITLSGVDRSLLYLMPLQSIFGQEDLLQCLRRLHQGESRRITCLCQLGESRYRIKAMTLEDDIHASLPSFAVVFDDVSEMIRLSNTIEQDAHQYQRLTQVVTAVLWEMDWSTQTITSISHPTLELVGYRDVAFLGRTEAWLDRIVPDDRERFRQLGMTLEIHQRAVCDYRMRHADGREIWVRSHLTRLPTGDNERRMAAVTLDISDLHQADQLRLASIEGLVGRLSHVINNGLTAMDGNLQLHHLKHHQDEGHAMDVHLQEALDASRQIAEVAQKMLAFAGNQLLRPTVIDLNQLVQDALTTLQLSAGSIAKLEFDLAPELWQCEVDAQGMVTALSHLCDNARQAMRDGGRIRIQTRNRTAQELDPAVPGYGREWIEASVEDEGTGMRDDVRQRALVPFFTTATRTKHYGLGLSMVHGFVSQSGGYLLIESEEGKGSRIVVRLPRWVPEQRTHENLHSSPSPKPTALLVEPDDAVRRTTEQLLEHLGLEVYAVPDADAAEVAFGAHSIDLLVVDARLSDGRQGVTLAERLAARNSEISILITSSGDVSSGSEKAWPSDWMLVRKPYSTGDLSEAVSQLLLRRSQALERQPRLSDREREVLHWIAAGKTQSQVGSLLGISERTVEQHIRSARRKLNAENTVHAVVEALAKQEIRRTGE